MTPEEKLDSLYPKYDKLVAKIRNLDIERSKIRKKLHEILIEINNEENRIRENNLWEKKRQESEKEL